ncbi:helix-turn-helix domain-containing protein [Acetobacter nitrogenifigens]|uniref:Cytoskeleton protein RodZ-like C-terminal domain-containing protein n=3 Tax=Acetobacter nitrogenifigens TaxID=285268 RepID=A0A511X5Q6_9PROT|nr:helix-turn-helix domain-containing protein [Acetobacter nitrogenifigens]GEN58274.1 hypothetical protein ANI02nite_01580 [Acetobacter nitrogenifigens DSM 23921 = NBRC 105050]
MSVVEAADREKMTAGQRVGETLPDASLVDGAESAPQPPPLPDVAAVGVGPALRLRREQLGWALPDVAAWLRIRLSYLEALESGQANALPGNAYALGFLRTYASAMGFSPEQVVARFKRDAKGVERKPELAFPVPAPERSVPAGAIVFAGIAVIVAAYVGWYVMVGHEPTALERVPPVASVLPGMAHGPSPSPQIASVMPRSGPSPLPPDRQPHVAVLAPVAQQENAAAPDGRVDAPQGAAPPSVVPPDTAVTSAQGASEAAAPGVPETAPALSTPSIRASAASWVQVRDGAGKVVYDHVMQSGDVWSAPADGGPFTFTAGNAGGVALALGDLVTPPLGRNGSVRRNIVLSSDAIRETAAASPEASVGTGLPASGAAAARQTPAQLAPSTSGGAAPPLSEGGAVAASSVNSDGGQNPSIQVAPVRRSAPKPPARREPTADELNAMQLRGTVAAPAAAGGDANRP